MSRRSDTKFQVWVPFRGETRDDAREILAINAKEAARIFGERDWTSADAWDELEVCVATEGTAATLYTVEVRPEPVFSVTRAK